MADHLDPIDEVPVPLGGMVEFAGVEAPEGFLPCDGRELSRDGYAELFAICGERFGPGDGSTTFNLPDKRRRVSVGAADTAELGQSDGFPVTSRSVQHHHRTDIAGSHSHPTDGHEHPAPPSMFQVWNDPDFTDMFDVLQPWDGDGDNYPVHHRQQSLTAAAVIQAAGDHDHIAGTTGPEDAPAWLVTHHIIRVR